MEFLEFDFLSLFSFTNLLAIALGTFVGLLIGALPGLGAPIAIVLLLPLTYSMDPLASILLLLAAFQAAEYGGSISAIILGIPGVPAAAATVLDGNALARQGSPGKALIYSLSASAIGGFIGGLVLFFLSVPLAKFALKLADPEFFLIGLLGLIAVATLSSKDFTKSMISVILGLMAGTVGIDSLTGSMRFTMARPELMEGMSMIALLVGMFAFSELFSLISKNLNTKFVTDKKELQTKLSFREFKKVVKPISIGSIIGSIVGLFPGLSAAGASYFSYAAAKKASKSPKSFGKGNPEGITAPESANNSSVGSSLVPLLSLGIPGSPTMAIIMGAFIIHGIQLGPRIFTSETTLVYGIFYGFLLTSIMLYVVGRFVTPMFARVLTVPTPHLVPTIFVFSIVGVFVSKGLFFELWLALAVGIVSYFLIMLNYSIASFILAFVLTPIIEDSLRRALLLSDGSYTIFLSRPYSLVLLFIILIIISIAIFNWFKKRTIQ